METILAIERNGWAAATHRENGFAAEVIEADVRDWLAGFAELGLAGFADIVLAGPPCTPFSDAGGRLGADDPNDCVPDFVEAIARIQPRQFLCENVTRLFGFHPNLVRDLERLGYRVEYRYVDAVNLGVPQHRRRLWIWGIRGDLLGVHMWPEPTHRPTGRTRSLFGDLQEWVSLGEAIDLPPAGPARRIDGASGWSGQRILDLREPAPTLTSAANPEFVEDSGVLRRLTVAECLRIQSAPRSFRWPAAIPKERQYAIAGNGWPCLVAFLMKEAMVKADPQSRTVLDLFAGGGLGNMGFHGWFWRRALSETARGLEV